MSLQQLKLLLAPPVWRIMRSTIQIPVFDPEQVSSPGPWIFACLHRDILPCIMFVRTARPCLLVSNSPDGDILLRTLGRRNYRFIRGSTGTDGGRAFVMLRRTLDEGHSVGLAVDGPKGPFGTIHEGVMQLARLTGRPVIPLLARAGRARQLGTWDRTLVPHPFSRVTIELGEELGLAASADPDEVAAFRSTLAAFLGGEGGVHAGA